MKTGRLKADVRQSLEGKGQRCWQEFERGCPVHCEAAYVWSLCRAEFSIIIVISQLSCRKISHSISAFEKYSSPNRTHSGDLPFVAYGILIIIIK